MKKFTLEKRGCNFYGDPATKNSDVGNYRVGIYEEQVKGKNGKMYSVEFTRWTRRTYRTTNKRTGAPLKNPILETVNPCALFVNLQYREDKGEGFVSSWADLELMQELSSLNLDYTIKGIETALEYITGKACVVSVERG